jgi:hypothetical protein
MKRFLTMAFLTLLFASPCVGQLMRSSSCGESQVETHLHFYYGPALTLAVAIDYRNISDHACQLSLTSFAPVEGGSIPAQI